jgi:radical SAM/Cys-rich protein
MHATLHRLAATDFPPLTRGALETLQVNLGYRCNQACLHCHVNAGPDRHEMMDRATVDEVVAALGACRIGTLDVTGGAPELNPHFRHLVGAARALGVRVIDRCNLTVLNEPGHEDLAAFLAGQRVEVTASLPCYTKDNVERQRGADVFESSLLALRKLNALGYARAGSGLVLNLVYNPLGPSLPPPQAALKADYRRELGALGIAFDDLYTLANMPIARFGSTLVSVDWQGWLYDCDFNQMLGLPLAAAGRARRHVRDLAAGSIAGAAIAVADHCYGCTAGQGSSCGGALA